MPPRGLLQPVGHVEVIGLVEDDLIGGAHRLLFFRNLNLNLDLGLTRRHRDDRRSGRLRTLRSADRAQGALVVASQRGAAVKAGRNDGDPHLVAERVVDNRAKDDVGVRVGGFLDQPGC